MRRSTTRLPQVELDLASFERLARSRAIVPVWREVRGDAVTPVSAYRRLRSRTPSFLLESVETGERLGRYSLLGDRPLVRLRLDHDRATIEEAGRRTVVPGPPIEALRTLLSRFHSAPHAGLPRFVGGLVGYLSYAAARWFEPRVPARLGPDPDFPVGEWMLASRMIVFDNIRHRLKLVACVRPDEHATVRAAYASARATLEELEQVLARRDPPDPAPAQVRVARARWTQREFVAAVARARAYILAGDCMQVVLSRRVEASYRGDAFELYRNLRSISPTPYLFFLRFGPRVLCGASPELLVRVEDGRVTVRPIAGTRPRGATAVEDEQQAAELTADPKERAEHVMLLDLGRNDVGRVATPGTVRIDEREVIERFSHVMHLVSRVSGEVAPGRDLIDIIAATFPAGTVSGAPKVRAMEIIDELEPLPRGPYAGAVGCLGFDGSMDLALAIRTLTLAGHKLRCQAGAGIVHDSVPEREYAETEHKMRAALGALGPMRGARQQGRRR